MGYNLIFTTCTRTETKPSFMSKFDCDENNQMPIRPWS